MRRITTLFNPLVKTDADNSFPNNWMLDFVTSGVEINSNTNLNDIVCLFHFEDILDASQSSYIRDGFKFLSKKYRNLSKSSFDITLSAYEDIPEKEIKFYCTGTSDDLIKMEYVMRNRFDSNVDTTYHSPALMLSDEKSIGWFDGRTGSFVFTDESIFNQMCDLLNIKKSVTNKPALLLT